MTIQNKHELMALATKLSNVSVQMTDALLADDIVNLSFALAVLYGTTKDIEANLREQLRDYYNEAR